MRPLVKFWLYNAAKPKQLDIVLLLILLNGLILPIGGQASGRVCVCRLRSRLVLLGLISNYYLVLFLRVLYPIYLIYININETTLLHTKNIFFSFLFLFQCTAAVHCYSVVEECIGIVQRHWYSAAALV